MQNFGKIKNAFSELMVEGMVSNDEEKKKLFKKYVKSLKENEILKTQFLVYENIENKIESNREKATEFVKENIALLTKYSKKDLLEANSKIYKSILSEQVVDGYINETLHDNISKLIFTKRTPKTIDTIVEATSAIVDYILSNKEKVVTETYDVPNSMLSSILVEKYNEKYGDLISETEREVISVLLNSNDDEKLEMYSKLTRECIDLIDERLNESDLETKDKLLRVKDKLLRTDITINEDFNKNISKLVDLRLTLNNNDK